MRRTSPLLLVVAVGVASMIAVAVPAGAVTKGATCTKATFKTNLKTFTATGVISGCSNLPATGGHGTVVTNFKVLTHITTKITWNGTGTTSYLGTEKHGPKTNTCKGSGKTKDTLIVSTGKFTGGTSKALAFFKGTTYTEALCATSKSATYLEPGSKIVFK